MAEATVRSPAEGTFRPSRAGRSVLEAAERMDEAAVELRSRAEEIAAESRRGRGAITRTSTRSTRPAPTG